MHGIRHTHFAGNRWVDGQGTEYITLYCATAIAKGQPVLIDYDGVQGPKTLVPSGQIQYPVKSVVAAESYDQGKIGIFAVSGQVVNTLVANGVAQGDHLELLPSGSSLVVDGTSGATNRTLVSAAIAMEANSSGVAALKQVLLFYELHQIAAS